MSFITDFKQTRKVPAREAPSQKGLTQKPKTFNHKRSALDKRNQTKPSTRHHKNHPAPHEDEVILPEIVVAPQYFISETFATNVTMAKGGDKGTLSVGARRRKQRRMTLAINASTVSQDVKDAAIKLLTQMKSMKEQTSNLSTYRNIKSNLKNSKPILDEQLLVVWAHAEDLTLIEKHLRHTTWYARLGVLLPCVKDVDFTTLQTNVDDDGADDAGADGNDEEVIEQQSSAAEEDDPHGFFKLTQKFRAKIYDAHLTAAESEELQQIVSRMSSKFTKVAKDAEYWEDKGKDYSKTVNALLEDRESFLVTQNTQLAAKLAEASDKEASLQKQVDDEREKLHAARLTHEMAQGTMALSIDNIVKNSRMTPEERETAEKYVSMAKQNHLDVLERQQVKYFTRQLDVARRDCTEAMVKLGRAENTIAKQTKLMNELTSVRDRLGYTYNAFDVANAIWFDRTGEQAKMKGLDRAARSELEKTAKGQDDLDIDAELNADPHHAFTGPAQRKRQRLIDEAGLASSSKRKRANSEGDDNGGEGSSQAVTFGGKGSSAKPYTLDEDDEDDSDDLDMDDIDRDSVSSELDRLEAEGDHPTPEELQEIMDNAEKEAVKGKGKKKEMEHAAETDEATMTAADVHMDDAVAQGDVQTEIGIAPAGVPQQVMPPVPTVQANVPQQVMPPAPTAQANVLQQVMPSVPAPNGKGRKVKPPAPPLNEEDSDEELLQTRRRKRQAATKSKAKTTALFDGRDGL